MFTALYVFNDLTETDSSIVCCDTVWCVPVINTKSMCMQVRQPNCRTVCVHLCEDNIIWPVALTLCMFLYVDIVYLCLNASHRGHL